MKSQLNGALLILATLFAGCASSSSPSPTVAARSEQGQLLQSAVVHFGQLKEQNQLPGIKSDEHGRLTTEVVPVREGAVTYPVVVSILARKNGDESVYRYRLLKDGSGSEWELVKATRLDKNGQVLEELPLK